MKCFSWFSTLNISYTFCTKIIHKKSNTFFSPNFVNLPDIYCLPASSLINMINSYYCLGFTNFTFSVFGKYMQNSNNLLLFTDVLHRRNALHSHWGAGGAPFLLGRLAPTHPPYARPAAPMRPLPVPQLPHGGRGARSRPYQGSQ